MNKSIFLSQIIGGFAVGVLFEVAFGAGLVWLAVICMLFFAFGMRYARIKQFSFTYFPLSLLVGFWSAEAMVMGEKFFESIIAPFFLVAVLSLILMIVFDVFVVNKHGLSKFDIGYSQKQGFYIDYKGNRKN